MVDDLVGSARVEVRASVRSLRRDLRTARDDVRRATSDMQQSADRAEVAMGGIGRTLTRDMARARTEVAGLGRDLGDASTLAASFVAALGGVATVRTIIDQADAFALLSARLRNVVGEGESVEAVFESLFTRAQAARAPVDEFVGLYIRLRQAISGIGDAEAQGVVTTLSQTLALSGANAAETASFLRQIGQALGNGVLRGDEFNSVMDSNSRFARLLADEIGVGTENLRGMAEQGLLTTAVLRDALAGGAGTIAAEFEALPLTVAGALTQLQNSILRYVGQTDSGLGASQRLAEGINLLSRNFETLAEVLIVVGALVGAGVLGKRIGAAVGSASREIRTAQAAAREENERVFAANRGIAERLQRQEDVVAGLRREVAELERLRAAIAQVRREQRERLQAQYFPEIRRAEANGDTNRERSLIRQYQREAVELERQLDRAERRLSRGLTPGLERMFGGSAQERLRSAMADLTRAQGAMADAMVVVNERTSLQARAMRGLQGAARGLQRGLGDLVSFMGGPWGVAFALATAALFAFREQAERARESAAAIRGGLEVLAFSSVNVGNASDEQADAQKRAADETERLRDLTGEAAKAADELSRAQTRGAEAADTQAQASAALAEVRRKEAVQTVATALAEAELERGRLASRLRAFQTQSARYDQYLRDPRLSGRRQREETELETSLAELERSIPILRDGLAALESGMLRIGGAASATAEATSSAAGAAGGLRLSLSGAADATERLIRLRRFDAADALPDPERGFDPSKLFSEEELARARSIAEEARTELQRLREEAAEIERLQLAQAFDDLGRSEEGARGLVEVLKEMARAAGDSAEALDRLRRAELPGVDREQAEDDIRRAGREGRADQDAAVNRLFQRRELANDVKGALRDAALSGDWRQAFGNALREAAERALSRVTDRIFERISGALWDPVANRVGSWANAGLNAAGSWISDLWGGARAGGGRGYANRIYEVGEAGRELFVPDTAGSFVSNRSLRAAMKGEGGGRGGDVYNIDARGAAAGVSAEIRAAIEQAKAEAVEVGARLGEARVVRRNDATRSRR